MSNWLYSLPDDHFRQSFSPFTGESYAKASGLLNDIARVLRQPTCVRLIAQCGLSHDEATAIAIFSSHCPFIFAHANRCLRLGDAAGAAPFMPFLSHLLLGLHKLPTFDGIVFRVWNSKDPALRGYHVGASVRWPQFSSCATQLNKALLDTFGVVEAESTSSDGKDATSFGSLSSEKRVMSSPSQRRPERGVLLALDVRGARRVSDISLFPHEAEVVLLPPWEARVNTSYDDDARSALSLSLDVDLSEFTVMEMSQANVTPRRGIVAQPTRTMLRRSRSATATTASDAPPHGAAKRLGRKARNQLAMLAQVAGNTAEAKRHLEKILSSPASDPNVHASAHNNLATLLIEEGDREGAKDKLQKALALKPTAARHNNFANLLSEDGDHAEAQRHYEAAIALNAGDKFAHLGLGRLLQLAFFDFAGARREYETAVAIDPGFATARYNLAHVGAVAGSTFNFDWSTDTAIVPPSRVVCNTTPGPAIGHCFLCTRRWCPRPHGRCARGRCRSHHARGSGGNDGSGSRALCHRAVLRTA